jgi:hypothetical protein
MIYHVLSIFPNKQNFVDCISIVLMWQLTIQSVRPYSDVEVLSCQVTDVEMLSLQAR